MKQRGHAEHQSSGGRILETKGLIGLQSDNSCEGTSENYGAADSSTELDPCPLRTARARLAEDLAYRPKMPNVGQRLPGDQGTSTGYTGDREWFTASRRNRSPTPIGAAVELCVSAVVMFVNQLP
jgi:hypothetical protein